MSHVIRETRWDVDLQLLNATRGERNKTEGAGCRRKGTHERESEGDGEKNQCDDKWRSPQALKGRMKNGKREGCWKKGRRHEEEHSLNVRRGKKEEEMDEE